MANEEHLARLREGVEAWNQWRWENQTVIPDLNGADLAEARLQGANLSNTKLQAYLWGTQLQGADLQFAQLQEADLRKARLQGAKLASAKLNKAVLLEAELNKAKLWRAQLYGSELEGTILQEADLRDAEGVRLDETNIKDIRVDLRFGKFLERQWNPFFIHKPRAIPWIELRRAYTGVNFLLTLVALLAFLFPYALQAGYLQALNWFQATLVETTPILKESLDSVNETTPLVNPTSSLVSYLENR